MKKHVNPNDLLHKVYTEQGGVKEYNKNQQGALKLAGVIFLWQKISRILDKIEYMEIKATMVLDENK